MNAKGTAAVLRKNAKRRIWGRIFGNRGMVNPLGSLERVGSAGLIWRKRLQEDFAKYVRRTRRRIGDTSGYPIRGNSRFHLASFIGQRHNPTKHRLQCGRRNAVKHCSAACFYAATKAGTVSVVWSTIFVQHSFSNKLVVWSLSNKVTRTKVQWKTTVLYPTKVFTVLLLCITRFA